jgi:hypothetical protein
MTPPQFHAEGVKVADLLFKVLPAARKLPLRELQQCARAFCVRMAVLGELQNETRAGATNSKPAQSSPESTRANGQP